tara:strand:- start:245 stop:493 length:249 start_codon:yes stop_codon:yes gene_type:complete
MTQVNMNEIKSVAYMNQNINLPIRIWAKNLGMTQSKTASLYSKYVKLGVINAKGYNRERSRKLAQMHKAKFDYEQLKKELQL